VAYEKLYVPKFLSEPAEMLARSKSGSRAVYESISFGQSFKLAYHFSTKMVLESLV